MTSPFPPKGMDSLGWSSLIDWCPSCVVGVPAWGHCSSPELGLHTSMDGDGDDIPPPVEALERFTNSLPWPARSETPALVDLYPDSQDAEEEEGSGDDLAESEPYSWDLEDLELRPDDLTFDTALERFVHVSTIHGSEYSGIQYDSVPPLLAATSDFHSLVCLEHWLYVLNRSGGERFTTAQFIERLRWYGLEWAVQGVPMATIASRASALCCGRIGIFAP